MDPKSSFQYVIDTSAQCVLATWVGDVSAQSIAESQRKILADTQFLAGMHVLLDCRAAIFVEVDLFTLNTIVPLFREFDSQRHESRSAFVVSSSFDYGVIRQLGLLLDAKSAVEKIDRQPFYELEDACAWLGVPLEVLDRLPVVMGCETPTPRAVEATARAS